MCTDAADFIMSARQILLAPVSQMRSISTLGARFCWVCRMSLSQKLLQLIFKTFWEEPCSRLFTNGCKRVGLCTCYPQVQSMLAVSLTNQLTARCLLS